MNFNEFSLLDLQISDRYVWRYELHPPHLISVATLPCESQNTGNVILQRDITKENCIRWSQLHGSGPGSSRALNLFISDFVQQCVHGIKIHDFEDLWKRLMQIWFDSDQDIIDTAIDQ